MSHTQTTAFWPAMTRYIFTNCKLIWKLLRTMQHDGFSHLDISVTVCSVSGSTVSPTCNFLVGIHVSLGGPHSVFGLACVSVIWVCVWCLFCMPLFILHSAELIVRCGPHKSVHGNASQSSHLSSFHASPSSSACVVRHASVSLCVRFCIKICCFIMEWLSFILFVFESMCVFRIDSGFSMKRFLSKMEKLISHHSTKWFVSPLQMWFTELKKATAFSSLSFWIKVQRFLNFSGKIKIADNLQHQQLLYFDVRTVAFLK